MIKSAFLVVAGLAISLATASTSAHAEDAVAGLKLGASRAQVLQALGPQLSISRLTGSRGEELIWNSAGIDVQLCNGKVVAVTEKLPGGVHEFARLVKDEAEARSGAAMNALNDLSTAGENSTIAAEWPIAEGTLRIGVSADAKSQLNIFRQVHWNRLCGASPKN